MTLTTIKKAGLDEIALDHVFTIGASGSSAYTFQGEGLNGTVNNPTLYLTRGKTYRFENGSGGHPIRIQSTSGASGTAYNTGVTNNAGSGTVIVEVQHDAPDVLYYQCTSHPNMNGILYTVGALADGGVTTAKLADDAVTNAKLADNAVQGAIIASGGIGSGKLAADSVSNTNIIDGNVTSSELGTNAVTTAKIADDAVTSAKVADNAVARPSIQDNAVNADKIADSSVNTAKILDEAVTLAKLPHGTSSNDGKFLRANNGADPTFETVSSGAISSIAGDAAQRVIVSDGDGTATCSNQMVFDGHKLQLLGTSNSRCLELNPGSNAGTIVFDRNGSMTSMIRGSDGNSNVAGSSGGGSRIELAKEKIHFRTFPYVGNIGDAVTYTTRASVTTDGITFNGDTAAANALDDYEEGTWTPILDRASGNIGGTLHSSVGMYVKVGKLVYITFHVYRTSAGGGSSYYQLSGLPFGVDSTNQGSWSISPHMTRSYFDSDKAAGDNAIGIKFLGSNNTYGYTYDADTDNWFTTSVGTIVIKGQMTYITAS